jgi:hypothetical protein
MFAVMTLQLTAAGDDYVHNNIRHEFLSVKQGPPGLQEVFRIFTLLLPDSLFTFSAAKYCKVCVCALTVFAVFILANKMQQMPSTVVTLMSCTAYGFLAELCFWTP